MRYLFEYHPSFIYNKFMKKIKDFNINLGILREPIKIKEDNIPLLEYPRPQLVRDSYLCLNGPWDFNIQKDRERCLKFNKKINVPYAIETPLSGISLLASIDDYLIYHRVVKIPASLINDRYILHFDGVDQCIEVFINNESVYKNIGGYLPFKVDITKYLINNDTIDIYLIVKDVSDSSYHSFGKQSINRGGIWYTTSSGIWKSVWLESVPTFYIENIRFTPLFDRGSVGVYIESNYEGEATILIDKEQEIKLRTNEYSVIKLDKVREWNLEDPYLYDVKVSLLNDTITSYFGLRKIEIKDDGKGHNKIYLNNKKIFLTGILDQGYYYLGNLTPAKDEDFISDIKNLKELGFNMIRKHIKLEPLRFYYHCDRLGMLVFQDFINGGRKYNNFFISAPSILPYKFKDSRYSLYKRDDEAGRMEFIEESKGIMDLTYSSPSVVEYTIFNEGWGQFDTKKIYDMVLSKDKTRLIDANSGWFDMYVGDFLSKHTYFIPIKNKKDRHSRAYFLSEYGGYSHKVEDHYFGTSIFSSYHYYRTRKILEKKYIKLIDKSILPIIKKDLSCCVYTQLSDVEDEVNGLYTFDRKVLKISKDIILELNERMKEIGSK